MPRPQLLGIALVQGLALLALYRATVNGLWPSETPLWSFPLWTLALVLPVVALLTLEHGNARRVALASAAFAVGALVGVFALSVAVASFKVLMYLQQQASGLPLSYQLLFTFSWRNLLVTALAVLFVLVFGLILVLWGALFEVIEIAFFAELFESDWFLLPALSFAFGVGVVIFRELTNVIDSITRLLQGLSKLLLPIVVLVATLFLLALPVTGLSVLWATGRGTALLLWLMALTLFFVNAVYQDGRGEPPYPVSIHRLVYAGLLTLLPVSAVGLYGLALRIGQYGWTVQRSWAAVVWLLLTLFALGYAWGIVRRRDRWPQALAQVNTVMGWVVLAVLLLANSPLLDFRKLSVRSQLARVDAGAIERSELDFHYFSQALARPGHLALEELKREIGDSDPALLAPIETPMPESLARRLESPAELRAKLRYRPADLKVPPELGTLLDIEASRYGPALRTAVLLEVDLTADARNEYVLLRVLEGGGVLGSLFYRSGSEWLMGQLAAEGTALSTEELTLAVETGPVSAAPPKFSDLEAGALRLRVGPVLSATTRADGRSPAMAP